MRTKIIKIYKFEELSADAQETAIENQQNDEDYLNCDWYSFLYEEFKEELKKIGINCENFFFDLYDNSFEMDNQSVEDFENFLNSFEKSKKWLMLKNIEGKDLDFYDIEICKDGRVYIHIDGFDWERNEEIKNELIELDEDLTEEIQEKLKGFLKRLREDYEYLQSEESIRENFIMNEREFLEDGQNP